MDSICVTISSPEEFDAVTEICGEYGHRWAVEPGPICKKTSTYIRTNEEKLLHHGSDMRNANTYYIKKTYTYDEFLKLNKKVMYL